MRESMGGIVADHRPPFVVDFDLQLNAELDYLARLCTRTGSILRNNRIVFNIKGNSYRLVVAEV